MQKAFNNFIWKNYPSIDSPLNEQNLMRINSGLNTVDDRVITLDTTKFDKTEAQGLIKSLTFNRANGVFTIAYYNGSKVTIDTLLEKLAVNFDFDESTQQLVITLDDGTVKRVDLSAFIKPLELIDSDTVDFQLLADGKVTAIVKEGSIQEKHLRPNYLADIRVESAKAEQSATQSASSAKESESWAHGNTGVRPGENTDNSKYWSEQSHGYADSWKGSLLPQGTIPYEQLPTTGNVPGHMYNISNAFVTDSRFKDGAGYSYPAGTNVYWTQDGKWDCLSGALTMELTQAEYDALSDAEKLNGTIYYIFDGDNTLTWATDKEMGLVIVDSVLSETSANPVQNKIVTSALNQKAPLASPALTGVPTAPTPAANTNSTQIATTAFVKAVINALIDGAPETLDTLKEIADAITNNETVVQALNAAIGNKVDKVAGKGLSTNDYTTAEKNKLSGIAAGAEVNVQADWNVTDNTLDAFIKNKPVIPAAVAIKGNAESTYRTGNVNLTPANIGLGNVNNTADSNKDVASASRLRSRGNVTAETGANLPSVAGLSMSQAYNNGYPTAYGNVLTLYGGGVSQLMLGWSGSEKGIVSLYYRNKRDVASNQWSDWREIAFTTSNVASATKATQDDDGNIIKNTYLKYQVLTQAQYNALTDAQKKNGLLYFVSDAK